MRGEAVAGRPAHRPPSPHPPFSPNGQLVPPGHSHESHASGSLPPDRMRLGAIGWHGRPSPTGHPSVSSSRQPARATGPTPYGSRPMRLPSSSAAHGHMPLVAARPSTPSPHFLFGTASEGPPGLALTEAAPRGSLSLRPLSAMCCGGGMPPPPPLSFFLSAEWPARGHRAATGGGNRSPPPTHPLSLSLAPFSPPPLSSLAGGQSLPTWRRAMAWSETDGWGGL